MKIERHVLDKQSYESSINLLLKDPILHSKLIVEGSVLASINIANLVLHLSGKIKESEDLKHNKIEGIILREGVFGTKSLEISKLFRNLEDLKYAVVHGSSVSKDDVEKSFSIYLALLKIFSEIEPKLKEVLSNERVLNKFDGKGVLWKESLVKVF